jgi:predicted acetyltransferase
MTDASLVKPGFDYLPSYRAALERGWSPDNTRAAVAVEHLATIEQDAAGFLAALDDPEARGAPFRAPDGTLIPRLPGIIRWIWDGEFCGSLGLRWQPGTSDLPPHILGHIGYSIVPWKRRQGHATRGLRLLLPMAPEQGLDHVVLTTDPENLYSQRVILACGGHLLGPYRKPAAFGGGEGLRYRVDLAASGDDQPGFGA